MRNRLFVCILLLAFPTLSFAQPGKPSPKQQGVSENSLGSDGWNSDEYQQQVMSFLLNPLFQKELEMSDDQRNKVRELQQKLFDGYREIYDTFPELKDPKLEYKRRTEIYGKLQNDYTVLRKKIEAEVMENLGSNQKVVLMQIQFKHAMRYYGVSGTLTNSPFAEDLGTTDDQKKELLRIKEETEEAIQKLVEAKRKEGKEKMLNVLSAEQRNRVKKLEQGNSMPGKTRL